jgi:hypothetical protein
MDNFTNFLEIMKTEANSALVESMQSGYNSIFDTNLIATQDEEKELSNGFVDKLKTVISNRTRTDLTPAYKLFPTLDGLTLKVCRAILNNPKTPDGSKDVFKRMGSRIENKYRRANVPVPIDGID